MPNYGDPKYWETRYKEQKDSTFDWLEDYGTLKQIIDEFKLDKEGKVLVLGCGNAEFSEDMYDDGYNNIYNIDISEFVIKSMKERNINRTNMLYEVMDVRDIKYPDKFFDIAVDKSTIDALLCGDNSFLNVAIMTKEVQRVLKNNGIYMVISYGAPENRVFHFEREHLAFDINIYTIKKDYNDNDEKSEKVHYVYICKKKPEAENITQDTFNKVNYVINKVYMELEKQELEEMQNNYEEDEGNEEEFEENEAEVREEAKEIANN